MFRDSRVLPHPAAPRMLALVAVSAAAVAVGISVAVTPTSRAIVIGATVSFMILALLAREAHPSIWFVEVPVFLVLASTLVWRVRDAGALATAPLDAAGLVRLGFLLGAVGLVAVGMTLRPFRRGRSVSVTLYTAYALSVFLAVPLAVYPALTAFRAFELLALVFVVVGACSASSRGTLRALSVVYWFAVGLVVTAWIGLILAPSRALAAGSEEVQAVVSRAPIPGRLTGLFPTLSSDQLGFLGALLLVWSVGIYSARPGPGRRRWLVIALLSLVTLLAAQFRTGYLMVLISLTVLLVLRRPRWLAPIALGSAAVGVLLSGKLAAVVSRFVLRGETGSTLSGFNGRQAWWSQAIDVWGESPLVGKGLLTAARFEVLEPLGFTETYGIHSAWLEALVGTGVIGLALLALSVAVVGRQALLTREPLPLALWTALVVASFTWTTVERVVYAAVLYLVLAIWVWERTRSSSPPRAKVHGLPHLRHQGARTTKAV